MRRTIRLFLVCALCTVAACSSTKSGTDGVDDPNGAGLSESELNRQREGRFGEAGIPTAEGEGIFRDVQFDFDSSTISDSARQDLEFNSQVLKDRSELQVQLEGHSDERGTSEYNLALGARRARAVYDVLVSYGVEPSRLSTISYGEDVPLNPAHTEDAWAQNRRVHFSAHSGNTSPAPAGGAARGGQAKDDLRW